MDPVRLDPSAPFASLLSWLAALSRALGIEFSPRAADIPLRRGDAAAVRRELADWSRQLRAVIFAEAARLAARFVSTLRFGRPAVAATDRQACAQSGARSRPSAPAGRVVAIGSSLRAAGPRCSAVAKSIPKAKRAVRRDPAELLDADQRAALKVRVHAVLLALRDPSAATRRLARRLAQRLARARQAEAARRERRRFPYPPRALGVVRLRAMSPEPRPPDDRPTGGASALRPAARPTATVAAASVLATSPLGLASLDGSPAGGGAEQRRASQVLSSPACGGGGGAKRTPVGGRHSADHAFFQLRAA